MLPLALTLAACDPGIDLEVVNPCGAPVEVLVWGDAAAPSDEALRAMTFVAVAPGKQLVELLGEGWDGGLVLVRTPGEPGSATAVEVTDDRVIRLQTSACP